MDLEVWLIGTPAEVTAARRALSEVGRVAGVSTPQPLSGNDSGRVRAYLRVAVAMNATGTRPPPKAAGATPPPLTLPDAA